MRQCAVGHDLESFERPVDLVRSGGLAIIHLVGEIGPVPIARGRALFGDFVRASGLYLLIYLCDFALCGGPVRACSL